MTEGDARDWIGARFGAVAVDRLSRFVELLEEENRTQNLVAPATMAAVWSRHVVDSAQLIELAPSKGEWLDVGTGGGFPGLVIALLRDEPALLVEPRRRRAAFLEHCVERLAAFHASVSATRVQNVTTRAAIISARAVASASVIFADAEHCAAPETLWLLPRGRDTVEQIADAEQRWRGVFHVKQSVTSPTSCILVVNQVRRR